MSDQLEVTEYLRDNLHFIDKRRVGIWGWSYGGYTAAMALANPLSLFQCGISVAPVVSWKLYGKYTLPMIDVIHLLLFISKMRCLTSNCGKGGCPLKKCMAVLQHETSQNT